MLEDALAFLAPVECHLPDAIHAFTWHCQGNCEVHPIPAPLPVAQTGLESDAYFVDMLPRSPGNTANDIPLRAEIARVLDRSLQQGNLREFEGIRVRIARFIPANTGN